MALYEARAEYQKLKPNSVNNEVLYAACLIARFGAATTIDAINDADGEDCYECLHLAKKQRKHRPPRCVMISQRHNLPTVLLRKTLH